jgi:hypothetical protein
MTGVANNEFSQHKIRAELEAMVIGDLLGPAGGDNEELIERSVRDRYLVGVLAPSRQAESKASDEEEEEFPLIPDELSEGGSDSADDGTTDADVSVSQAFLPSSLGLSFCVDSDAKAITVSASWGQYKREKREDREDYKGNTLKVWQRYPRGGDVTFALTEGTVKPKFP